jgi:hypothetical protein
VYGVVKFKKAPLKSRGTGRDGFFWSFSIWISQFLNFLSYWLSDS